MEDTTGWPVAGTGTNRFLSGVPGAQSLHRRNYVAFGRPTSVPEALEPTPEQFKRGDGSFT